MQGALAGAAALGLGAFASPARAAKRDFKISVAGWSLHKEIEAGEIKSIDCFRIMREQFDIDAFELVNNLLEVPTSAYTRSLAREAEKFNVEIPLIMVDSERPLGDADRDVRMLGVRDHLKWLYMASDLGCHSIRVNWRGEDEGARKALDKAAAFVTRSVDAFRELCERAAKFDLNVIIENHGGPSSYPEILAALMKAVHPNLTPDEFDNALAAGDLTDDLGAPGRDNIYGFGLINARKAVLAALALATGQGSNPGPILTASASNLNFGAFLDTLDFTVQNVGTGSLTINSVTPIKRG